jgi:hypothetical protein
MSTKYNRNNRNQQSGQTEGKLNPLEGLERIAVEMDMICRRRLPNGRISRLNLAGREPEIRQRALIKAVGGFLQRNPTYIQATKYKDENALSVAMELCAVLTLRYSKWEIIRELTHEARQIHLEEYHGGFSQHPSDMQPSDWPVDVIAGAVKTSVDRAVQEGRLSLANAGIVAMRCYQNQPVSQIARLLGITPKAVYLQLNRARNVIPGLSKWIEVLWCSDEVGSDKDSVGRVGTTGRRM